MNSKFSPRLNEVLSYSREEALRLGHNAIGPEHFLLGILRDGQGSAAMILKALNVDLTALRKVKEISMVPTVPIAFMGSALIISIFHFPFGDLNEKFLFFLLGYILEVLVSFLVSILVLMF